MDWKAIEALGYSYYISLGYKIYIPIIEFSCSDFVIEKDGQLKRVNVKVAGLKDKRYKNSWSISLSGNRKHNINEVDIFLVWLPSTEKFIELQGDFFKGTISKCKRLFPIVP